MAIRKIKTASFGACSFRKTSPPLAKLSPQTRVLNVLIPFEDALKLNVAIDECVRKLNSYNRSFRTGKNAGLCLAVHLDKGRVTITEAGL